MTNSKQIKKAFFTSMLVLLMCLAILVGTTFAWFTDSVSTRSKIQAGTLDVQLLKDGVDISDSEEKVFDYNLWEPGYTASAALAV